MKYVYGLVFLILLTIAIVVPKWICSFYLFPDEDFLIKILSETRSIPHYPLANNISDFNSLIFLTHLPSYFMNLLSICQRK